MLAQKALDGLPVRKPRATRTDPRFAAYVPEFWRDYAGHWKASTQKRNRQAIDNILIPFFVRRHIGTIDRADILAWRDAMQDRQGLFNHDLPVPAAMLGYAEKLVNCIHSRIGGHWRRACRRRRMRTSSPVTS
ncbi:MAG TPA: hypothetical protein VF503_14555 [Sphingobium sp.]|uniref:hypothetical protein n=1 Tax=Sphingobium sp. TaxID=1912891 RepID=UPI002ED421E9